MSIFVFGPLTFQTPSVVTLNRSSLFERKVIFSLRSVSLDIPQAKRESTGYAGWFRDDELLQLSVVLPNADALTVEDCADLAFSIQAVATQIAVPDSFDIGVRVTHGI